MEAKDVDIVEVLEFAKNYASLDEAVAEQIEDLLDGHYNDVSPDAVDQIRERLGGLHEDLGEALEDYSNWSEAPAANELRAADEACDQNRMKA